MTRSRDALLSTLAEPFDIQLLTAKLCLLPAGAVWWPDEGTLIVSDLHLEKGSSYAARGQMLPPYDTGTTLSLVEHLASTYGPRRIVSLGDSFHDRSAELRIAEADRARIRVLTASVDWIWVEGNHDPDPPEDLGGRAAKQLDIGPLVFRHEPTGARGEVSGHLHPVVKVRARHRAVRCRCFASDGLRLVLPAMGALTGGLNICDPAFAAALPNGTTAYALGEQRIHRIDEARHEPDRYAHGGVWRA